MSHLTDAQLSALLDDALAVPERVACDAHLAECEACRARVAEYSALDESLSQALTHDPGDAYFVDFAERVQARISAESRAGAPAGAGTRASARSPWQWLVSPRGLSLVGGTAALLAVAGLAWMRFQRQDDVARVLRSAAPGTVGTTAREQAAPPSQEGSPVPPPTAQPGAGVTTGGKRASRLDALPPAAPAPTASLEAPQANALRAREVRRLENGEEVPVRPKASLAEPGAADRSRLNERESSAGVGVPIAEMKRRALVPAAGEAPATVKPRARDAAPAPTLAQSAPSPAPSPAPATPAPTHKERAGSTWGSAKALYDERVPSASRAESTVHLLTPRGITSREAQSNTGPPALALAAELASPCGTVHDTHGRALAGVQIIALGAVARTARTGPDGRFCLTSLHAGDTLSVLRVGYEPIRVVVTPSTSLALQLEPVGTLEPTAGKLAFGKDQASLTRAPQPDDGRSFARSAPMTAPIADVYATQSASVRQAVTGAREALIRARRERTAASYERAADRWERVGVLTTGQSSYDARFQGLGALREAYRLERSEARRTRLLSRLVTFIASAPETLPERATALRWQAAIESESR